MDGVRPITLESRPATYELLVYSPERIRGPRMFFGAL
jgi:hypothetical protein